MMRLLLLYFLLRPHYKLHWRDFPVCQTLRKHLYSLSKRSKAGDGASGQYISRFVCLFCWLQLSQRSHPPHCRLFPMNCTRVRFTFGLSTRSFSPGKLDGVSSLVNLETVDLTGLKCLLSTPFRTNCKSLRPTMVDDRRGGFLRARQWHQWWCYQFFHDDCWSNNSGYWRRRYQRHD